MNFNELSGWGHGLTTTVRPILTFLVTIIYNVALVWALSVGKLQVMEYITAVGPVNAMIVGFWFGERKTKAEGEGAK